MTARLQLEIVAYIEGEDAHAAAELLRDLASQNMLNLPVKDLLRRELAGQVAEYRVTYCDVCAVDNPYEVMP
jgi:hypothetical protein